jgi:nitrite reductase/ring-hydroxylating ferredoxin subunit
VSAAEAAHAAPRHRVGAVGEFELNRFRVTEIGGKEVGVVRTARGFFAVNNRCPHQGADLCSGLLTETTMAPSRPHEYVLSHDQLILACPWHRWEFDLETGRAIGDITRKRMAVYPVEVVGDEVFVHVPGAADETGPAEEAAA